MIVLDACAAVDIVKQTTEGRALQTLMLKGEKIIAPEFFLAEIRNAFRNYVHVGTLTQAEAQQRIDEAVELVEAFIPMAENVDEAFAAACQYDHSVYDMFYLTVARRYDATLYTLDKRLQGVCRKARVNCVQLIDMSEELQ